MSMVSYGFQSLPEPISGWQQDAFGQLLVSMSYGRVERCLTMRIAFFSNVYAEEREKGAWRAIQWIGNTLGAIAGGCVALG